MAKKINISIINSIAVEAGKEILKVYHDDDFSKVVDFKADNSPLTLADQASHKVIAPALQQQYPDIPVISEEGKDIAYAVRKDWGYFWLVDPLDGTKEFIKRNGQFTVNIALIHQGAPVAGVIYTPVTGELYFAGKEGYVEDIEPGAYKQLGDGKTTKLEVNHKTDQLIAVRSSSHASEEEEKVLTAYRATENISKGSSLKFCMVAEGKADIYYRHGPTMEWDTAAGQAIVEGAGGAVYQGTSRKSFAYNKESLLNSSFLVIAKQ